MVREGVVAHLNFAVSGLHVIGFERRTADQAGIGDDSQTPDVNFVGVAGVGTIWVEEGVL